MPEKLAVMHHELGETLFVLEREPEAEAHYRKSLDLDREHRYAPDMMALLGRAIYFRSEGNQTLLDESYQSFAEAYAVMTSPEAEKYTPFFSREKLVFDSLFGMGVCKSEMTNDTERFEAAKLFEGAEQIAVQNRDYITADELMNVYRSWVALLERMGLERDAQLIAERASRNLN
jgi:hypothetical protein